MLSPCLCRRAAPAREILIHEISIYDISKHDRLDHHAAVSWYNKNDIAKIS